MTIEPRASEQDTISIINQSTVKERLADDRRSSVGVSIQLDHQYHGPDLRHGQIPLKQKKGRPLFSVADQYNQAQHPTSY